MSQTVDHLALPRVAIIGAGVLIALAFGAALLGRADIGASRIEDSPVVQSRRLVILQGEIGSATVFDAGDGHLIRSTGLSVEEGFVWGAINGLSYGRKQIGGALDAPYDLARRADGRLVLTDTVTNQRVMLDAFGRGNAAAFAWFLDEGATK